MTDAEKLDNIRRVVYFTGRYLDNNKRNHFEMGDFWRGYHTGMENLLRHLLEELNKGEEDE